MKTHVHRPVLVTLILCLSAAVAPAQWDDGDSTTSHGFGFFDFVLMLVRQPALTLRAAQANDQITASVTRGDGTVNTTLTLAPTDRLSVTVATATTRDSTGYAAMATISHPGTPAPLQIAASATRSHGTFTQDTTVSTPAGHVINTVRVFEPLDEDEFSVTTSVTRNAEPVHYSTRIVPSPRAPSRRGGR